MRPKNLLDFQDWDLEHLNAVLDNADTMLAVLDRPVKKVPALQGFTICTAFFENSTRTKTSFELAARRMSADVLSFAAGSSSLNKGESLRDTIETLTAYDVDAYIVRHAVAGVPHLVARYSSKPVINAGDGRRSHPTQALLDAYTIRQEFGDLKGLKVVIIGDILHSRVARSNVELLTMFGANVVLCGPAALLPYELQKTNIQMTTDIIKAMDGADVIISLRLQLERMKTGYLASSRDYIEQYQINEATLVNSAKHSIVLHPGPVNRDLEISAEIIDSDKSRILKQVTNGQAIRMSVLYHLLVGRN